MPLLAAFIPLSFSGFHRVALFLFFLVILVFSGLRYEVGPDWIGYYYIYESYIDFPVHEIAKFEEPGFFLLNKLSGQFGAGLQGVIFLSSFIFLLGCFIYARNTPSPWVSIAAVMPYLIFVVSMSGIRQASAIGIGLAMFARWPRSSTLEKLTLIALACSFHNSAIIFIVFLAYSLNKNAYIRILISTLVIVTAVYWLEAPDTFVRYRSTYVEDDLISSGAFYHVLLIAFPSAIYIFFWKRLAARGLHDANVLLASILTLGLMPFLAVSSTGVDRLTLYFSFVQMWVYPAIIGTKAVNGHIIKAGLVILVLSIFFVYFLFGSHASSYIPYNNFLLTF
jgi:hypothetical protein